MDYSDLLYEFSEGKTDPASEQALFERLAGDAGLRLELKTLFAYNSFLQENRGMFAAPDSSKAGILAAVTPGATAPASAGSIAAKFGSSKYLLIGAASIVAVILTTLLLLTGLRSENKGLKQEIAQLQNLVANYKKETAVNHIADKAHEAVISNINKSSAGPIVKNNPNIYSGPVKKNEVFTNEVVEEKEVNQIPVAFSPVQPLRKNITFNNPEVVNNVNQQLVFNNEEDKPEQTTRARFPELGSNSKFSLEFINSQYWFLPAPTISPKKYANFNNSGILLMYDLSDKLAAGLEVRQENFFLIYDGYEENDHFYRYEQQPNFTTFSLAGRYRPFEFFGRLTPFIQASAGGNNVGFVLRGSAGLEYAIAGKFSLVLDGNYNYMYFIRQNSGFGSNKAGINYGIKYKF